MNYIVPDRKPLFFENLTTPSDQPLLVDDPAMVFLSLPGFSKRKLQPKASSRPYSALRIVKKSFFQSLIRRLFYTTLDVVLHPAVTTALRNDECCEPAPQRQRSA